ncbi:MAG: iron chelate uptake ABC transporter family permease subunit [Syntrophomonadaceae bacterium]|nr:iron chelate uptake ABC transporter family permease subunit [Syntrophomonadaceae bacterium]
MSTDSPAVAGRIALQRGRWACVLAVMAAVLGAVTVLGVGWGAVRIPLGEVVAVLLDPQAHSASAFSTIIWDLRLPRVVLAGLVGTALALAGAGYQALFKNPMADPHIIGVSQGAALGACLAMVAGLQLQWAGIGAVPLAAFAGALAAAATVTLLARSAGGLPVATLLLAGIALGTLLNSLVSLLVFLSGQQLHSVIYWLMGGFSGRSWEYVRMCWPYVLAGSLLMLGLARELNALLLGEETAHHLGVEVEKVKFLLLGAASLLTATAVAASGVIGFVGLVIPHAVRLVVGPDHRVLLPAAGLTGATFLIAADILARTVLVPSEVPIGVITALFGAPFFIYLLLRRRRTDFHQGLD